MTDLPMTKADDDLVEKIRFYVGIRGGPAKDEDGNPIGTAWPMMLEAADAITRLRAQLAAAEARSDAWEKLAVENLNLSHKHFGALGHAESQLQAMRKALEFYVDPFAWKKAHDPEDVVRVPDFYSETCFGDTAMEALRSLTEGAGKC